MMQTEFISRRKFHSRRWEMTRYWTTELQRNPERSLVHEAVDDGLTEAQREEMYAYCKSHDMLEPCTRAESNKLAWEAKRGLRDRRLKRVHVDKFWRELGSRSAKPSER